jgi:hypothetical protein
MQIAVVVVSLESFVAEGEVAKELVEALEVVR